MGRPFKKLTPAQQARLVAEQALSPATSQAAHQARLKWYAALDIAIVEIVPLPDACPACRALGGMLWSMGQAQARQPLPHRGCTRAPCRCIYLPVR